MGSTGDKLSDVYRLEERAKASIALTVIICTHNPRMEYLRRVLNALRAQSISIDSWELVLVDNRSREELSRTVDLGWHPLGIHVREERLGLTAARLCGIRRSRGALLVFIDDDNVIEPDYLRDCVRIGNDCPFLGAWGGQQIPEFEAEPPEFARPLLGYLACRSFEKISWSNVPFTHEALPYGAGMCLRRQVALHYLRSITSDSAAMNLDRVGQELTGCGDHDMAFTACDVGLGMGLFPELKLVHLIPKDRLEKQYFLRLLEGHAYSLLLLRKRRGQVISGPPEQNILKKSFYAARRLFRRMEGKGFEVQIDNACRRGHRRALSEITAKRAQ